VKQMASIEHCEAWIHHIWNSNIPSPLGSIEEEVAITPDAHFHISKSQNSPENVMMFLRKHSKDPAIKVSQSLRQPCQSLLIQITGLSPKAQMFSTF